MDAIEDELMRDDPPGRWRFLFSWPSFFIIAWVLYELTSQASLGVTFLCSKFGWEYFRTALWLKRRDPDKIRGKIGFWIFAAAGLWRAALVGTILMFVYAFAHMDKQRQPQEPPKEGIEAMLVVFFGFLISGLTTLRAVGLALLYRKKIWLDPGVNKSRSKDLWPPTGSDQNKAGTLITTSFIVVIVFPTLCLSVSGLIDFAWMQNVVASVAVMGVLYMFMFPILILLQRDLLQRKVLAQYPEECWNQIVDLPNSKDL